MAQLLSPVCTDALKVQNALHSLCSGNRWRVLPNNSLSWSCHRGSGRRRGFGRVKVATGDSVQSEALADDYYSVLGLLPDASPKQIKKAYYNCMKACHPDLSGNDTETTNFCMFINEVYAVLSDPVQRMIYDEIHGYALTATNPFLDDSCPKDHAFVDEFSCIGCKNCASVAPEVFGIEEDFGRARVFSQCGNPELVQQAIDSCPVDCIHWTSAAQLSLLEDEMRRVERVNVGLMLSGMGSAGVDVFKMASSRWEKRQAKILEKAKLRMMKQKVLKQVMLSGTMCGASPGTIKILLQRTKGKREHKEQLQQLEDGESTQERVLINHPPLNFQRLFQTRKNEL